MSRRVQVVMRKKTLWTACGTAFAALGVTLAIVACSSDSTDGGGATSGTPTGPVDYPPPPEDDGGGGGGSSGCSLDMTLSGAIDEHLTATQCASAGRYSFLKTSDAKVSISIGFSLPLPALNVETPLPEVRIDQDLEDGGSRRFVATNVCTVTLSDQEGSNGLVVVTGSVTCTGPATDGKVSTGGSKDAGGSADGGSDDGGSDDGGSGAGDGGGASDPHAVTIGSFTFAGPVFDH